MTWSGGHFVAVCSPADVFLDALLCVCMLLCCSHCWLQGSGPAPPLLCLQGMQIKTFGC